jgi:hypothetical protein
MSLRKLLAGPGISRRASFASRYRYVPIIVLLVVSMVLAVGGVFVRRHLATLPPPAPSLSDPAPVTGSATAGAFASECRTPVAPPAQEPWLDGHAAAAEAIWQAHSSDLSKNYVVGTDGYVDWNDEINMNLSQAIGRRVLSEAEAKAWADYISSTQAKLAAMGIPFFVLVGPSKWQVYPENLPEWAQKIRGSSPLDQILAGYPALPIIDVRGDLRAASATNAVYSRVNSHWTDYGALVGWDAVTRCLNKVSPQLGPFTDPAVSSVTIGPDLSEFASYGVKNPVPDWTIPVYAKPLLPVAVTKTDALTQVVDGSTRSGLLDLPLSTATAGAQSDKSLLLVRDSMSDSLSVPAQQAFAQTWQINNNFDTPGNTANVVDLAKQLHPNVVILEFAERYLNNPAPPPAG